MAAKHKINQPVDINGEKRWITANSMQEFADKVLKLAGPEVSTAQAPEKHLFSGYAWNWFETYSAPNIETVTATTYRRQLRLYLVQHIGALKNPLDRAYLALQALHPLRLEEVLGLQPEDIDAERMTIHIRRAVTHPTRNLPEIKDTKTSSSHRTIGLSALALPYLQELPPSGRFLFGGDKPLSYTQVRRMCQRIQRETGFTESITPTRFRTTVLTDLYDQTKDIKLARAAAAVDKLYSA